MGEREIEFVLPKRGIVAVATLLETAAPRTCAVVWDLLPVEGQLYHARRSGREIGLMVHNPDKPIPPENQSVICESGDVFLFYYPAGERGNAEPRTTIAVFYGRDTAPLGLEGPTPGNYFAKLQARSEEFALACERIWREGWETLIIRRWE